MQGDYKVLPSCFDSDYVWAPDATYCEGSDESRACPDSIEANGKKYTLAGIRPWDGACPDPEDTETECASTGEAVCFDPPESEGVLVRKMLEANRRKLLKANRRLSEANKRKLSEANRRLSEANRRKLSEANKRKLSEANRRLSEANRRLTEEEANKRRCGAGMSSSAQLHCA